MIDSQGGVLLLRKEAGEEPEESEACQAVESAGTKFYTLSQFRLHSYLP